MRDHLFVMQVKNSNWGFAKALARMGANPNQQDSDGLPPVYWAAILNSGDGLRIVLQVGADPNPVIKSDNINLIPFMLSPLAICVQHGNNTMVDNLLSHGAHITNQVMFTVQTKDMLLKLLRHGGRVPRATAEGSTLLHAAAASRSDDVDLVKFLVAYGLDVRAMDKEGITPLHRAVSFRNLLIAEYLIDNGADINAMSTYGTPLHTSIRDGFWDSNVVKMLLGRGADVNAVSKDGTPLDLAMREIRLFSEALGSPPTALRDIATLLCTHGGKESQH